MIKLHARFSLPPVNFKHFLSASLLALSASAVATPIIQVSVNSNLGHDEKTITDGSDEVSIFGFDNFSNASARASAATSGSYELDARQSGAGSTTASYAYRDSFTNTSGNTNNYNFSFHVDSIFLNASGRTDSSFAGSLSAASYSYQVLVNGVSLFTSSAGVFFDNDGSTYANTEFDKFNLKITTGHDDFSNSDSARGESDGFDGIIDFGALAAGESFNFEVFAFINASRSPSALCASASSDCDGFSEAYFKDPFDLGEDNRGFHINVANTNTPNDVPEPGSLSLMGLGLVGFLRLRHRKARKA